MLTAPKSNSRYLSIRLTDYSIGCSAARRPIPKAWLPTSTAVGGYFELALCAFATRNAHRAHRVSDVHEK